MRTVLISALLVCLMNVSVGAEEKEDAAAKKDAFAWNAEIGRGVNLGNALEAPTEGAWGITLTEEYFELIAEAGFDSVRVPIRWSAHADEEAPYGIDPEFLKRVDWVVDQALSRGLVAIINMHHYREREAKPEEHFDRFLAIWKQIADHFKDRPPQLFFEPLNEPHDPITVELWNEYAARTIKAIRDTNPDRMIVVGPTRWNNVKALDTLKLPEDDRNLIVTFHYYLPFQFTHQGAGWVGGNSQEWLGTRWTGSEKEKESVRKDLDLATAFAKERNRPIFMGEFGAYEKAPMESRARWTRFVRTEAEKRGFSWAYWEFGAGFGVYDRQAGKWREPLRDALLGKTVADLPVGAHPEALGFPHFPSREHAFVWRNWESVSLERMARVLGAKPEQIGEMGRSMGLPPHQDPTPDQWKRSHVAIIRRNWHLLPYDQLLTLLDWTPEELAFSLKEDDFLYIKLGNLKPKCPQLKYSEPDEAALDRCAEMKAIVEKHFADALKQPAEPRFAFVKEMSTPIDWRPAEADAGDKPLRYLYSYFGIYGDPLLNPELEAYPEGLLQRLARQGVTGVWLHTVLRQLAPSDIFPEFGEGAEKRLATLRDLVQLADRYGIKVYLYMNEPRSMGPAFFEKHPDVVGVREGDNIAMCTSVPKVRKWMADSLAHVFAEVPGLGGVFTITGSENLTNCWSHHQGANCPRCGKRKPEEVIAEVNNTIAEGVWRSAPDAKVIVWDWGWNDQWADGIISRLPEKAYLQSVSEWSMQIERGGETATVGEYSISSVGPGPRATRHWKLARERGLTPVAKMQVNASWEMSAVPYLPVMNLVAEHCRNLRERGVENAMLSWTVGGSPSPNLEVVRRILSENGENESVEEPMHAIARERYGSKAAPEGLEAWALFANGFREYPFEGQFVYRGPVQYGPSNLLYSEPTDYASTMIGFPYDDYENWSGQFSIDVTASQFEKVAAAWRDGIAKLDEALDQVEGAEARKNLESDRRMAETGMLHFASVANLVHFFQARDRLLGGDLSKEERSKAVETVKTTTRDEMKAAEKLFALTRRDSRIGYEASNQYYYYPTDLIEKVINCEYVLNKWLPSETQDEK